jgi:two-component system, NtrC family, nitrogen regulation response regulator GlnG
MMKMTNPELPVLLVDDEESILSGEVKALRASGINNLLKLSDPREVMPLLEKNEVEAVLLDIRMPHIPGDELLLKIREKFPEIPVIIITASDEIELAVKCIKAGAFDYMVKAVEPGRLISGINKAIQFRRINRKYSNLRKHLLSDKLQNPEIFKNIVTRNNRMHAVFVFIESIAVSSETILIKGETGSGKELFADCIHNASGRSGMLVKVNAAGLDDAVFSDTLFGHKKGAFTGAEADRKGLIQQAEGGTVFLDEIGDLSVSSQIKLLRILENFEYYPVGSDLPKSTDARFIVATHKDLAGLVESGQFRKDLYYRLQTHEISIPPLKDRKDDLPLLLEYFLNEASEKLEKKKLNYPKELITLLETYDFPGNVRELRSMIFNAVSQQKEKMLSLKAFRDAMGITDERKIPVKTEDDFVFPKRLPTIKEITEKLINEALKRAKGNNAIAAGLLGITPQALSKRLSRRDKN